MIEIFNKEIREFISYISNDAVPPVELYVIPGYDTIETPEGKKAFAVYDTAANQILVPGESSDKDIILSSIAHEYYHHIERCSNVEHDENEAEAFAESMIKLWTEYKKILSIKEKEYR